MDADASFDPGDLPVVADPVAAGDADLMLGRRSVQGKGAWPLHARIGNRVLAAELRRRIGVPVRDLGPMRAARREALLALPMSDRRFGYPLEMVVRAAEAGWRISETDVPYYPRTGKSKVTGTLGGTVRTVRDMRRVLASITAPASSTRRPRPCQPRPCQPRPCQPRPCQPCPGRPRRDRRHLRGPAPAGRRSGKPRAAGPAILDPPAWSRAGRLLAAQVVVIAKEPVPGRVKTRLTPPFTPEEAAALAEAALTDTLAAVADTTVARRVLALDGTPGRWLPPGFDVIGQRGAGLDERIAWALADARVTLPLPVVLIGMDTPQVTPGLLAAAVEPLVSRTADATFGMAEDGGFWLLGLREVDPALILGVPMSQPDTGSRQLARLEQAGLRVRMLPELTDVDTVTEAEHIAAVTPGSRFAACMAGLRDGAEQAVAAAR